MDIYLVKVRFKLLCLNSMRHTFNLSASHGLVTWLLCQFHELYSTYKSSIFTSVLLLLLWYGTVVLVFQPAEEGYGGAKKMIEDGAVENIDAIFGLHVGNVVPIGVLASRPGPIMAGSGFFEAVISGKGGHAALPHHTIGPILTASNVIVSLQQLVSREADPLDSQVLPHPLSNYYFVAAYAVYFHTRMCILQ
jgi:hypothetical protein